MIPIQADHDQINKLNQFPRERFKQPLWLSFVAGDGSCTIPEGGMPESRTQHRVDLSHCEKVWNLVFLFAPTLERIWVWMILIGFPTTERNYRGLSGMNGAHNVWPNDR